MDSIEYNKGVFPKKFIEELIERKEESVPYLINYLEYIDKYDYVEAKEIIEIIVLNSLTLYKIRHIIVNKLINKYVDREK